VPLITAYPIPHFEGIAKSDRVPIVRDTKRHPLEGTDRCGGIESGHECTGKC